MLDLVPILSYVVQRGRCRHCRAPIAIRYPITELLCVAWVILLYRRVGPGLDYPFLAVWGALLIALVWIDLDFQLLPDAITFPGTLIGLAAVLQWPLGARHALFGVIAGSGPLWLLAWAYLKVRKVDGMGEGTSSSPRCSASCWAGSFRCSRCSSPPWPAARGWLADVAPAGRRA